VAEDHQTKNARALVDKEAALMISDAKAHALLVDEALKLLYDEQRTAQLAANISKLAMPQAAEGIVDEIEKLIGIRTNGSVLSGITNRAMLIG
jgi:UDP-N-acetylglucosamine--N-acetylmuramyl-(pentapeptide) pyrophosphoryl-undecaprenol N-acetylglucosamine transferase